MKIAIDFETYLISDEQPNPKPVCLSYAISGGDSGLVVGMDDIRVWLQVILSKPDITIIAHNFSFEGGVIVEWFPELWDLLWDRIQGENIFCTKLYAQLINNISKKQIHNFSLANLVLQYFSEDISEDKKNPDAWRLRYSELDEVPLHKWPAEAKRYAIDDSIWALKAYEHQTMGHKLEFKAHVAAELALNIMGKFGIAVDTERVAHLEEELLSKVTPLRDYLISQGYAKLNKQGRVQKEIKKFREHIQENFADVMETTVSGAVSTSKESLDKYLTYNPNDQVLSTFRDIMDYEKVLTSFVARLKTVNTVIRTEYNAIVSSGRTSSRTSSAFPSVNMQQMPRKVDGVEFDVRNCFVPREGFEIVSIDYNGLELSSTAHQLKTLYRYSNMANTVNSGDYPTDMHSMFACRLKKCSYEEFMKNKKDPEFARYRQLAKPINLGFPGGIGYDTMRSLLLRDGVETSFKVIHESEREREIDWLIRKHHKEYPSLRKKRTGYRKWAMVLDELVTLKKELFSLYPDLNSFLTSTHKKFLTGNKKQQKNEWGEWENEPMYAFNTHRVQRDWCTYTSFCNGYLMQTPSAVGAKAALTEAVRKYYRHPDVNILAFIHDEILFEVRKGAENKHELIADVAEIMLDKMQEVLYNVRIAVEADLMSYWKKSGGHWQKTFWKDPGKKELRSA